MREGQSHKEGISLEQRLAQDAQRLVETGPDVLGRCEFPPRPRRLKPESGLRRLARAAVCGALVVFLFVGADERAGMRGAGRFLPSAQPRLDTPVAPAAAVKELAAFLSGEHPLEEEWKALSRDGKRFLEEFTKRVAPLANVVQAVEGDQEQD